MTDLATIEVLKVWYSLFCTLMDDVSLTPFGKLEKLRQLRQELRERLPQVEQALKQERM